MGGFKSYGKGVALIVDGKKEREIPVTVGVIDRVKASRRFGYSELGDHVDAEEWIAHTAWTAAGRADEKIKAMAFEEWLEVYLGMAFEEDKKQTSPGEAQTPA